MVNDLLQLEHLVFRTCIDECAMGELRGERLPVSSVTAMFANCSPLIATLSAIAVFHPASRRK
jgi:hypothetical protein